MKISISIIALLFTANLCTAQKIRYQVSFPNAIHHEASIALMVTDLPGKPVIFKMSRSSPGRYATHEFGKNIYDVKAVNKNGKTIAINRIDGDVYEVPVHDGAITVTYTLFANYADGTYASIDPESIHLNMPACFMWVKGLEKAPIELRFFLPTGNKGRIATQLYPTADPTLFTAPDLAYFMDSPVKIGDLIFREWTIPKANGQSFTVRIALEAKAAPEQVDELAEKVQKIVAAAKEVFGEYPAYENNTYTFLISATPYVVGDGMEHRNSTMITSPPIGGFNAGVLAAVTAHEYFHNWNIERIRPRSLEPFNFEKSNMSDALWFAEGFTEYYGELLLARTGISSERNYLATLSDLVNTKMNTAGAIYYSPIDASNHAVYVDAAVSIDKNNYANIFSSYYTYGGAIALALDLELQTKFGKPLDAFMQAMWQRFGKTEQPYTIAQMQETLASLSTPTFAAAFFQQYIKGHEMIDYAALLDNAGYELRKTNEGKASFGMNTRTNQGTVVIGSNTVKGTAAYEAGLDVNDEILQLDDTKVKSVSDLNNFLQQKKPGDQVSVLYKHRGVEKQTKLMLQENKQLSIVPFEETGKTVTASMKKIRQSWFSTTIK